MILKYNCKHFPGDRPCFANKNEGLICECKYYEPVDFRILIIKLDAVGDVLRTTSMLHAIKEKYPSSYITWLTKSSSKEIFYNNHLVNEVIIFEDPALYARLLSEEFDLLIHTDANPNSAALAAIVNANEKKGYILDEIGKVKPVNNDAVEWLEMGAFDQFKKSNIKTYQQIIHEIVGLPYNKGKIIINLTAKEKALRDKFYNDSNLNRFKYLIGLNTGSSKRWKLKQWHFEKYVSLIEKLSSDSSIGILLYGGKEEIEKNNKLKEIFPNVIDTGSENTLREFFALMDLTNLVITGDTLALHVATALEKRIICLFGPTSFNEIEDYGLITKVYAMDLDCLVCYKNECTCSPNCMDLISVDEIHSLIYTTLKSIEEKSL